MSLWDSVWLPHKHHKTPKRNLKTPKRNLSSIYSNRYMQDTCEKGTTLANKEPEATHLPTKEPCNTLAKLAGPAKSRGNTPAAYNSNSYIRNGATHLQLTIQVPVLDIVMVLIIKTNKMISF